MKKNKPVFISGWGSGIKAWEKAASLLSCEYDYVPWGECLSDKFNDNTLFKLLDSAEEPIILAGWSLGGMISLSAGIHFSRKISGVVLISSSARMIEDRDYDGIGLHVLRSMKARLKGDKNGLIRDFAAMAGHNPPGDPTIKDDYIHEALALDANHLSCGLSYLMQADFRNVLDKIDFPVKIIHGADDHIIKPSNSKFLYENLKNASLDMIPGIGHFTPYYAPEIIANKIGEILNCQT